LSLTYRAIWGGLLPSVVIISAYFIIADSALIFQILYFRKHAGERRYSDRSQRSLSGESNPLLPRRVSFVDSPPSTRLRIVAQYIGALAIVIAAGVIGWLLSSENQPRDTPPPSRADELGPKVLGYLSAVLYLSARIPQIWHNYKLKSTEGLSLLFFMFSTLGNVSFAASILFATTNMDYLMLNVPWLIGSAGTVFFDFTVSILHLT
jgi:solute carrier family 66 (lysosomal lysine-arginine transporter), member 1